MSKLPSFEQFNESLKADINEGVFHRLPKNIISDELYLTSKNLQNFYDRTAAGNDVDPGVIDTIIRGLDKVKKAVKRFNSKEEVLGSVYEGSDVNPTVKRSCVERLSQFFRVSPNALSHFKFDGTDNIKALSKALNSTSDEGTEAYYKVAIKVGKQDAGINESDFNEGEVLLYDEIGTELEALKKKISGLMKSATDKKWVSALGAALTAISNLDRNLSQYDAKLGSIVTESEMNEGDMTNFYDGFKVLNDKTGKMTKFKYIKGTKNQNVENEAIAKLMKVTGLTRPNFGVHGFVKKGEWNNDETPVLESEVNEASVQVAGNAKPSGAQVLATVIVEHLIARDFLKPGIDKMKKDVIKDIQKVIMDSTF